MNNPHSYSAEKIRYAIEVIAEDRVVRWENDARRGSTFDVTHDEYKLAKALLAVTQSIGPSYDHKKEVRAMRLAKAILDDPESWRSAKELAQMFIDLHPQIATGD